MTAPLVARPLVAAIDAAVEQCQQSIVQLMRAREEILRLVDGAIDDYEAERDPVPYKDYLPQPEAETATMFDDPILFPNQKMAQSVKRRLEHGIEAMRGER